MVARGGGVSPDCLIGLAGLSFATMLRRLTALISVLVLFQAAWEKNGVACMAGHGSEAPATDCPQPGTPAECAAMPGCASVVVAIATAPTLSRELEISGLRLPEPDVSVSTPSSRPPVPPPRA